MRSKHLSLFFLLMLISLNVVAQAGEAQLRVGLLIADDTPLVLRLSGPEERVWDLLPEQALDPFNLVAGEYRLTLLDADTSLLDFTLEAGGRYTLLVYADQEADLAASLLPMDDRVIADGEGRLIVFHTLDANVDLLLDGALFAPDIEGGVDGVLTLDLLAGVYEVALSPAGDPETLLRTVDALRLPDQGQVVLALGGQAEPALLVLTDSLAEEDAASATAEPEPQAEPTLLRYWHLSSGTPPLDLYINGVRQDFSPLSFPDASPWLRLDAGTYRVAVTVANEPIQAALIGPLEVTLDAGTFNHLTTIGALANNSVELHHIQETFNALGTNQFYLNVFNADPNLGAVNLTRGNEVSLVSRLGYPGFFGANDGLSTLVLPTGTYVLTFTGAASGQTVLELPARRFVAGRSYFVAVIRADPPFLLTFSDIAETRALLASDTAD